MSETKDRFLNAEFSPGWMEIEVSKPLKKTLDELIQEKELIAQSLENIELKLENLSNRRKLNQLDLS